MLTRPGFPGWPAALRRAAPAKLFSTKEAIETVPLAYEVWKPKSAATASPIVFLHGLFGNKANNRTVSKVFARDLNCDVYCPDLRNHGESPHHQRHDYFAMAADVERFIKDHSIENPVVIGHSMGARTAMAVALNNPDMVSKLIPVDNGPVSTKLSSDFPQFVRGMQAVERAKVDHQKDALKIIAPYAPDIGVQQFLLSNFKKEDGIYKCRLPLDILGKSLGYVGEFEFPKDQFRYTGPTLLIRGTKSHFVPDDCLPLMGELFPRFKVVDIDAGHWVISENPKEFIRVTEEFLDNSD